MSLESEGNYGEISEEGSSDGITSAADEVSKSSAYDVLTNLVHPLMKFLGQFGKLRVDKDSTAEFLLC